MAVCRTAGGGSISPRERMSERPVEVYEITPEEVNRAIERRLSELNVTRKELTRRHAARKLSAEEFKLWMLIKSNEDVK